MSSCDLLGLIAADDYPVRPDPVFADELLVRLVCELERPADNRLPRLTVRALAAAAALLLLVAGVATAAYKLVVAGGSAPRPAGGTLTLIGDNGKDFATIVALGPDGRTRPVWHCPHKVFCGDPTSLDWSRDGRYVAFTLTEIGGRSAYVGLHIVDVRTGHDRHLPNLPYLKHPLSLHQPDSVFDALRRAALTSLGCTLPGDVAWSPDGRLLAYACSRGFAPATHGSIHTIHSDGTGLRRIDTGTRYALAPSWSPDGKRIAFATWTRPYEKIRRDTTKPPLVFHSSLYVMNVDGTGRRLLAHDASSPSWSPDGSVIAYDSRTGVKLISPSGADMTPAPRVAVAVPGLPRYSPDGSELAVATDHGVLLVDTSTWQSTLATSANGAGILDTGRPAWYPGPTAPFVPAQRSAPVCTPC